MLYILDVLVDFLDGHLLRPLTTVIDAVIAGVYYFLWVSYFIGYCLVEGSTQVWKFLRFAASGIHRHYSDLYYTTQGVTEYFYRGTTHGLRNVRDLCQSVGLFLCNLLIELGNFVLWVLMLLPRFLMFIFDCVVEFVMHSIVARGLSLLNSVFRLSIGLTLLLVLYMFRRYVYLLLIYLLHRARLEITTKTQSVYLWTDQQLTRFKENMRKEPVNASPPQGGGCVICLERIRTIVIMPCRHLCLCCECCDQLMLRYENRCPVCRNDAVQYLSVYV
ncbi:uncharacterized protein LOC110184949 [Drosophila serrata]|uniref:uncharacterized protein LOC110184949 n=1 Tax=Drosophila serrata TaxID=7274 RepID=UPI000A1D1795|nr:uncharacterized protein LOC110184949 [Drosophila serrata]